MDILDAAIAYERGVGRLAAALGIPQNQVSMWRNRNVIPKPWRIALSAKYSKHLRKAAKAAVISPVIDDGL